MWRDKDFDMDFIPYSYSLSYLAVIGTHIKYLFFRLHVLNRLQNAVGYCWITFPPQLKTSKIGSSPRIFYLVNSLWCDGIANLKRRDIFSGSGFCAFLSYFSLFEILFFRKRSFLLNNYLSNLTSSSVNLSEKLQITWSFFMRDGKFEALAWFVLFILMP